MKRKMKDRQTYQWWKGLYDLVKSDNTQGIMNYVFERLDKGSFRSGRNSYFNEEALKYVMNEHKTGNAALDYVMNEGRKKWEKS